RDPRILALQKRPGATPPDLGDALISMTSCNCKGKSELLFLQPPTLLTANPEQELMQGFARYFAAAERGYAHLEEAAKYPRARMREYSDDADVNLVLNHLAPMRDLARQISYRARWEQM